MPLTTAGRAVASLTTPAGVVSFLPEGWDWDVEMGFGPQLIATEEKVFMARQSGGGNRIEEQIPWSYTMI